MIMTKAKTIYISLASSAYRDEKLMEETVNDVTNMNGVEREQVNFAYNGIDGAGFNVKGNGDVEIEQLAATIAKLPHVEKVDLMDDEYHGKNSYPYVLFKQENGQISRSDEYFSWTPTPIKPDPDANKKFNISYISYAYNQLAQRKEVAEIVKAMPEVENVEFLEGGNDADSCLVTVKDPAVREIVTQKAKALPGVERTWNW